MMLSVGKNDLLLEYMSANHISVRDSKLTGINIFENAEGMLCIEVSFTTVKGIAMKLRFTDIKEYLFFDNGNSLSYITHSKFFKKGDIFCFCIDPYLEDEMLDTTIDNDYVVASILEGFVDTIPPVQASIPI